MLRLSPQLVALFAVACASAPSTRSAEGPVSADAPPAAPGRSPPAPVPEAPRAAEEPSMPAPDPGVVEPGVVDLPVPGHLPAVVSIPLRGASRGPVLVAAHGAGGTPEAHCAFWRGLVGAAAFVLCPRGLVMDATPSPAERGYYYPAHPELGREVLDALDALDARFPDRVERTGAVYAGFSQGAIMGALFFARDPAPFARLILVEGGGEDWTDGRARAFAEHGGRRVLFACGRRSCADAARRASERLRRAGVETRTAGAVGTGHTLGGAVGDGVIAALPWLFDGDARWGAVAGGPTLGDAATRW